MRSVRYLSAFLLAVVTLFVPSKSSAQIAVGVGISVHIGPPALPVYVQPPCPSAGYIWTPGYWAYGDDGYYWVPGTWVLAPQPGFLWTPGYWGFVGGAYGWHGGYWGPHVGFYGGINYGFGYGGVGFEGGRWDHGVFAYNRSVTNVNTTVINNTYNKTVVVNNTTVNNTSFNGEGGVKAQPTAAERSAESEHHIQPTSAQMDHQHQASTNRAQLASVNGGKPAVAASPKPGVFSGKGVVQAKAAGSPAGNANHPAANTAKTDRPPSAAAKSNTAAMSKTNTNNGSNKPANASSNSNRPTNTSSNSNKPASANSNSNRPANASKSVSSNRPPATTNRTASPPHSNAPHPQGGNGNKPPAEHTKQPR